MAQVKVVILNWNGREHLSRFLPSVVDNTPQGIEVVVADNGSTDDSLELLAREFPKVGVLKLDRNYGYARGYNLALSHERFLETDYFILLNSDVEVTAGWCEPLMEAMEADDNIAAAAPKILSYTDRDMFEYAGASGGFIDGLGYPFCRGRIMSHIEKDEGQYDSARDVFWASGACMVVRADVFRELGGFDSDFFAHMEEIDLCWRAQLRGYRVVVEPRSVVYHLGGGTLATNSPKKTYLNFRNNLAMLYKNLSSRSLVPVMAVRMVMDGASAMVYLLSGRAKLFKAVWRAHIDFHAMRPTLKYKRAQIQSRRISSPRNIYRGSIVLRYAFGYRRFGRVSPDTRVRPRTPN